MPLWPRRATTTADSPLPEQPLWRSRPWRRGTEALAQCRARCRVRSQVRRSYHDGHRQSLLAVGEGPLGYDRLSRSHWADAILHPREEAVETASADLVRQALSLPEAEREELLLVLAVSLDGPASAEDRTVLSPAWQREVRARREALRSGKITATPWDEAMANIFDDPD